MAISNNRIIKVEEGKVTFRWRDYEDHGRIKLMTVEPFEFIRQFLLHILPNNFVKIRHYGLLSNRNRKTKLRRCQKILGSTSNQEQQSTESVGWERSLFELTGIDPRICPCCKTCPRENGERPDGHQGDFSSLGALHLSGRRDKQVIRESFNSSLMNEIAGLNSHNHSGAASFNRIASEIECR